MKILFAVSNEKISDTVIKFYQREYKEILSYKNVYYFNAIQRELQMNNTYDVIVISEDLEPYNGGFDAIDRFIFDRLDRISDEATNNMRNDTPIIFICSDRRNKSEDFLVKLFSIGIYNALIGGDRKISEICKLIRHPRTKKEAKLYYKIDSEEVKYSPEDENEVSEVEIQNILNHYKRLGRNEEQYIRSFDSIAAQYNEEQLKIIANILPMNVKAVLEARSPAYQKVMTSSVGNYVDQNSNNGLSMNFISDKTNQINGNIVIPSAINNNVKKVYTEDQNTTAIDENTSDSFNTMPEVNNETYNVNSYDFSDLNGNSGNEVITNEYNQNNNNDNNIDVNNNDGNLNDFNDNSNILDDGLNSLNEGLNSLDEIENENVDNSVKKIDDIETPKRGRGRPRKNPLPENNFETEEPKRKRGRPRKNNISDEEIINDSNNDGNIDLFDLSNDNIDDSKTDKKPVNDILDEIPTVEKENNQNNWNTLPNTDTVEDDPWSPISNNEEQNNQEDWNTLPNTDTVENDPWSPISNDEEQNNQEDWNTLPNTDTVENDPWSPISNDEEQNNQEDWNTLPNTDTVENDPWNPISNVEEQNDQENWNTLSNNNQIENDAWNEISNEEQNNNEQWNAIPNGQTVNNNSWNQESTQNNYYSEQNNYNNDIVNTNQKDVNLQALLVGNKKLVSVVGTSKNGTSFIVNNIASDLADSGINVAILDTTKNKNSYYIYTQNEENLRKIASESINNLQMGVAKGINVSRNLTVYTSLPDESVGIENYRPILQTLVQSHDLILIDCDFETPLGYFLESQELYLVQSLDVLTIQPLTAFLRDLKTQNVLEPDKLRIVINKNMKVRGLTDKAIIGGMSYYNEPAMSFMTELFNRDNVKYCSIPFEQQTYSKYLEGLVNCKISLNGYSKEFIQYLKILSNMVYPLINARPSKKGKNGGFGNYGQTQFSQGMNDSLNRMKNNY